ncbi:arylsulfatase A-like enzyme [Dyadobacter jejuensis]|uniref:Arylsulfatase A-like enzyme n=1 Tax=Dyadobacter jejuensis TaxID=1082580 RepID=A0A316AK01_9BACT|nr:arylsulfatase [Dyadobacter jejuensis]PWJ57931.1 arylsulfatase A-like enzyme [Dyadobacter jejuensis]
MRSKYYIIKMAFALSLFLAVHSLLYGQQSVSRRPNVILILTDDQGIGDLGCHGNPWLKTPNIDSFYEHAVRFTNFHVSPMCTPTRGALMTGRYPIHNGAWATYKGRDALSERAYTMADLFQRNGYATGLFGKWHLGDNYPVRPTDSGFDVALHHLAGGVGELSDYWGNNYFDDVYFMNNKPVQFKGYCTDVWFDQAMRFMKSKKDAPFFVYLPTNAPHTPLYVDQKYAKPYQALEKEHKIVSADYYGMLANLDENFGKLEAFLKENNLADNTILIFMTDNGTANGISQDGTVGYNMGLRGRKGDQIDGGHRVPFFIQWIEGNIHGGWDIEQAAAHVDLLPTLANLCQIDLPSDLLLDGVNLSALMQHKGARIEERNLFIHYRQDWRPPTDIDNTCVIMNQWRLVNGNELYDLSKDRMQLENVAAKYPELAQRMRDENAGFVRSAKTTTEYTEFPVAVLGNPSQTEIKLTIQHAIGENPGFWKSEQVAEGLKCGNNTHAIKVEKEGMYRIACRRWPKECSGPILGIPSKNPKNWFSYKAITPDKVRIQVANQMLEKNIGPTDEEIAFEVYLEKGKTFLVSDFIEGKNRYGVYYTYITTLPEKP